MNPIEPTKVGRPSEPGEYDDGMLRARRHR
jgi:hypothetical protein